MNRVLVAALALALGLAWSSALHASDHRDGPGKTSYASGCANPPAATIDVKRAGHAPTSAAR